MEYFGRLLMLELDLWRGDVGGARSKGVHGTACLISSVPDKLMPGTFFFFPRKSDTCSRFISEVVLYTLL